MIQFGTSWWLLIPCLALALFAAFLAYRYSPFRPPMPWRILLPALRTCALFLCLALLLRPLWRHSDDRTEPPILAVLADESLSIARHDSLMRATLRSLPPLSVRIQLYGFSNKTRTLADADSLAVSGVRTDIGSALASIRTALADEHMRSVLLLSDGQYNTGRNPLYVASESAVPVYTMAIGDTVEQQDIKISRVVTNEIGYVGTAVPIEIAVLASGFENRPIQVSLAQGGNIRSTVHATLPANGTVLPIRMEYVPQTAGIHQLTARITHLEGEVTHSNNTAALTLEILDSRQRVLVVAGAPHPDLAAIRGLLLREKEREVATLVQKDAHSFYEGALADSLLTYDLIILVGYPGPNANLQVAQRLASSGTRLFFLLTRKTSLNLLRDAFGESLPVIPTQGRSVFEEAVFELTEQGRQHAALQNLAQFSTLQLPPLQYDAVQWQVSPDAVVLAQAKADGVTVKGPFLVVRSRGGLRTAALLGAGTWRWKTLPEDLAEGDPWWPTLFENLVQWLLAPEDNRRVRIRPLQQSFAGTEPIRFGGRVFDESLQAVDGASVVIDVTAPDGSQHPYTLAGLGNGRYSADIGTLPEGAYTYEARAIRLESLLGTDTGGFTVGPPVLEHAETRANLPLLRQIAHRSGGQYLTVHQMDELKHLLEADSTFAPRSVAHTSERALWQWPLPLIVILMLITLEWVLRKRIGMT